MDAIEANTLITLGARIDPRLGRADAVEQAYVAEAWAELLHDVALAEAEAAMMTLLRRQVSGAPVLMPADILQLVGIVDEEPTAYRDITAEWMAESKTRALEAAGVTEEEFEAHQHDRVWIDIHFPKQIETGDENA